VAKAEALTWGDLASRLKGRRNLRGRGRSEKSAEAVVVTSVAGDEGPNGRESETTVSPDKTGPQMARQLELPLEREGEAQPGKRSEEVPSAANGNERSGASGLMELVVERQNLLTALQQVKQNKGSPGTDGMTVEELVPYLKEHWVEIRQELLEGTYRPRSVRRQLIPKSDGGMRELGIPCALDRLVQQAILQVLQPWFDPGFSPHSYGFRPGRSAHGAVLQAQKYVEAGYLWVVDVDLEKFFDRVNHDVLMGRLAKRIQDKRLLRLIRGYLNAGVMFHGVVMERHEGTPQGGPLSPLLANLLLDEVDQELQKRGHHFVRYADLCGHPHKSAYAEARVMPRGRCDCCACRAF
jgi:retron-type reverse transcriptase